MWKVESGKVESGEWKVDSGAVPDLTQVSERNTERNAAFATCA